MSMRLEMTIMSVEDEISLLTAYCIKMYKKIEDECRLVHLCELNRLNILIKAKKADLFLLEAMRDSNKTVSYINHIEKSLDADKQRIENGPRSLLVGQYIVNALPKRKISDKIDITFHIQDKSASLTRLQRIKRIVSSFLKNLFKN